MQKMNSDIDIVIPWVDGSDPAWRELKSKYSGISNVEDAHRFRDWGWLKYVFRGIEKNLPWIRKVHFITCGHLPTWLNVDCPKLNIVYHEDYIPQKWLPTFSSHPIELNIHRIQGLSEKIIYINDDIFFIKPMEESDFFEKGFPKSQAGLDVIHNIDREFIGILYSDLEVINRNFNSREIVRSNFLKFINVKYGFRENFKTMLLLPFCVGFFPGFSFFHGPNAYLKSTIAEVWEKETNMLSETCSHRFRTYTDVNQYLFLWWQWCEGKILPEGLESRLLFLSMDKDTNFLTSSIEKTSCPLLCINDCEIDNLEEKKEAVTDALNKILGSKSQFEL